jgi:hypothetical protein
MLHVLVVVSEYSQDMPKLEAVTVMIPKKY